MKRNNLRRLRTFDFLGRPPTATENNSNVKLKVENLGQEKKKMNNFRRPQVARWVNRSVLCFLVTLACAIAANSQTQSTTGTIQGTVTDANGAIVPGASVEIRNLETNLSKTLTTDDGGRFVALALPPGNYSVTVSKQGFGTLV